MESSFGMKPICTYGLHAAFQVGVEDAVEDRPVVNRVALGVLAVSAGGTPLQRRRAVAGGQQIVRAEINLLAAPSSPSSAEQLLAVLHVGVVRLVGAEEPPDGTQLAFGLGGVHANSNWKVIPACAVLAAFLLIRKTERTAQTQLNEHKFVFRHRRGKILLAAIARGSSESGTHVQPDGAAGSNATPVLISGSQLPGLPRFSRHSDPVRPAPCNFPRESAEAGAL